MMSFDQSVDAATQTPRAETELPKLEIGTAEHHGREGGGCHRDGAASGSHVAAILAADRVERGRDLAQACDLDGLEQLLEHVPTSARDLLQPGERGGPLPRVTLRESMHRIDLRALLIVARPHQLDHRRRAVALGAEE